MNLFVGVDGGGSKTDFAVSAADGVSMSTLRLSGCSYQSIGIEPAVKLISDGVRQCLAQADAQLADCAGCCIGIPCYGENSEADTRIAKLLQAALVPMPLYLANDVEVGWAGSLECHEGIHIVAGTGAIAFGRGSDGRSARCGGWVEFFGDEGSCYWLGRQAMGLFSKQADGRVPRGALYELVRQQLGITDDYRFVDIIMRDYAAQREQVALFQLYAYRAADAGDTSAQALYKDAARELAMLVSALRNKLSLSSTVAVSYSGGLFRAGELICKPLCERIEKLGCTLQAPKRSAIEGALLLAIELDTSITSIS